MIHTVTLPSHAHLDSSSLTAVTRPFILLCTQLSPVLLLMVCTLVKPHMVARRTLETIVELFSIGATTFLFRSMMDAHLAAMAIPGLTQRARTINVLKQMSLNAQINVLLEGQFPIRHVSMVNVLKLVSHNAPPPAMATFYHYKAV